MTGVQFESGELVRYTGSYRDMGGVGWIGRVVDYGSWTNVNVEWIFGPGESPKLGVYPENLEPCSPWQVLLAFDAA